MEPDFAASASYRELQRADSCSVEHPWDHGTAHPCDGAADLNRGGAVSRYDAVNELDPWTDSAGAVFSYCEKHVNGASGCHQCLRQRLLGLGGSGNNDSPLWRRGVSQAGESRCLQRTDPTRVLSAHHTMSCEVCYRDFRRCARSLRCAAEFQALCLKCTMRC